MSFRALPPAQGLYDPTLERDACGVGFVCNIKNRKSHEIIRQGLEILERLGARLHHQEAIDLTTEMLDRLPDPVTGSIRIETPVAETEEAEDGTASEDEGAA